MYVALQSFRLSIFQVFEERKQQINVKMDVLKEEQVSTCTCMCL